MQSSVRLCATAVQEQFGTVLCHSGTVGMVLFGLAITGYVIGLKCFMRPIRQARARKNILLLFVLK